MKINELEKMLGISKDNIRYYESQGLLSPKRDKNGYRHYEEEDIEQLKKIIVLRKMGVPVAEIHKVFQRAISLHEAIENAENTLQNQIDSFQGSILLCRDALNNEINIDTLDADKYLKQIEEVENQGKHFSTLKEDILSYSKDLLIDEWGRWQFFFPLFFPNIRHKKGNKVIAVIMMVMFVLGGGSLSYRAAMRRNTENPHGWLRGIFAFACLIVLWLIIQNIIRMIAVNHEKHRKSIMITGTVLSSLTMFVSVFVLFLFWYKVLYFHPYEDTIYLRNEPVTRVRILPEETYNYDYNVRDEAYIDQLIRLLKSYKPTGAYSLLETTPYTDTYYEIAFSYGDWMDNITDTFIYVYKDGNTIYIDEPSYGVWVADEKIYDFIKEYEEVKETDEGIIFEIDRWFTYRGTYQISDDAMETDIIRDRETGEDITEWFLNTYQEAYDQGDYDTIWQALNQYGREGRTMPMDSQDK